MAIGNALGNSIVRAAQSGNTGTTTTNEQSGGGDRGPRSGSQGAGTTGGGNFSQGAENLSQQNSIQFPDDGTERITVTPNWDEINNHDGFLPFSMTSLGMQVARSGVASANQYREQAQVLGDRVSQVNARIAATAGQNTIRDASYLAQFNNERGNGLIESPTTPGPWLDGYVFDPELQAEELFTYTQNETLKTLSDFNGNLGTALFGADLLKIGDAGVGVVYDYGRQASPTLGSIFDGGFGYASASKNPYLALGTADSFDEFVSLGSIADNQFVKGLGHLSTVGGPALSFIDYDNYVTQTGGQGPDVDLYKGKFVVDSVMAGVGTFGGAPGKIVSGVYGIFDGIAQSRPEYVSSYGSQAGRPVGGWTAIGARDFDNQVQRVIDGSHIFWGPKN